MATLSEVKETLAERRRRRSKVEVPLMALRLDDSGQLCVEGKTFQIGGKAWGDLAKSASIPPAFFRTSSPDVQAYLFNRLHPAQVRLKSPADNASLTIEDGCRVVGITTKRLALFSGDEVLGITLAEMPRAIEEDRLKVPRFRLNGDLHLSFVSPQLVTEPRVGDIVHGGIDIHHSDTAEFGTRIESYLLRLSCSNAMLSRVCQHNAETPARIRRASEENREHTRTRIAEMARTAWRELDAKMEAANRLAQEPVEDVEHLVESVAEKLRFPERLVEEIRAALGQDEMGPTGTLWDLISAFSRVGTHLERLSTATQRYLQELCGDLIGERIEQCPTCGRVLPHQLRYLPRR